MFTLVNEYKKQLNDLIPEQKIKHIDNMMNELKKLYYTNDVCNIPKKLHNIKCNSIRLKVLRSCIETTNLFQIYLLNLL